MSGGGGGGSSKTVQEIPAELKPLATAYTNKAMGLANTPYVPYTDQRYANLNPTQESGIQMATNRALSGSPTMTNAESSLNQMIQGGNTNPYLDQMVNQAQQSVVDQYNNMVKPQTEAAMQGSGSFGNSGLQQYLQNQQKQTGIELGNIASNMYGNAYNQDQANRMQAIGMAPTFGNQAYQNASQLLNAGGVQQDQAQKGLDFAYQQFQGAQNKPYQDLAAMSGVFGSNLGGTSTTTQNTGGK